MGGGGVGKGGPKRRFDFGFGCPGWTWCGGVVEGDIGRGKGRGKTAEAQMEEYSDHCTDLQHRPNPQQVAAAGLLACAEIMRGAAACSDAVVHSATMELPTAATSLFHLPLSFMHLHHPRRHR